MKKFALLIGTAALVFASCTKEMPGTDPNALQDVVFTNATEDGGLKGLKSGCDNPDADYAWVTITHMDGTSTVTENFYPLVFTVNGALYTQAIKLPAGIVYTATSFVLMHINGSQDNLLDNQGSDPVDAIVQASPTIGSPYAELVENVMPISFSVNAFTKSEIVVDYLCFEEVNYQNFGFTWFKPNFNSIRTMLFFGDFCTKFFMDYNISDYGGPTQNMAKVDMPAIFKIEVYKDNVIVGQPFFQNYGATTPLAVTYIDRPNEEDNYEFKLSILVKTGNAFNYVHMHTWSFKDAEKLVNNGKVGPGEDGVYDFVLGNCNALQADLALAPYMNLPVQATMNLNQLWPDRSRDGYFNMALSGFGSGFDINDFNIANPDLIRVPAFCFDLAHYVTPGHDYLVNIYSSLSDLSIMPARIKDQEWDQVNWLANHLSTFGTYTWKDLQQAFWVLSGTTNGPNGTVYNGEAAGGIETVMTPKGWEMVNAARANGNGYSPLPGGWAAVICFDLTGDQSVQTIFTIVDP